MSRYKTNPQSGLGPGGQTPDVTFSNNWNTVTGIMNTPINGPLNPGGLFMVDPSGATINTVTQVPASALDPSIVSRIVFDQQGLILYDPFGYPMYHQR
jgi:filamentous hemagglutinin family protein